MGMWAAAAVLAMAGSAENATPRLSAASPPVEFPALRPELLALAEGAADRFLANETVARPHLLTVIDYSLPSTAPRLWVIDRANRSLLFHRLVAHGRGSGENIATQFSNREGSLQSSLGLFLTQETYVGRNGYSLRLRGLEPGVNDRARERTLVMHGAPYVSREFAGRHGRLGRSWGCPALEPEIAAALIDSIREGSLLFVFAADPSWLEHSPFVVAEMVSPRLVAAANTTAF
jgi:L,D-transpeptidase catalytic domain